MANQQRENSQTILITGAAGNLGSLLARHIINQNREGHTQHRLSLMIHRRYVPQDIASAREVRVYQADLARPDTLIDPCQGVDCIVHFAGVLFAPRPERFLRETNTRYVENIVNVALEAGVKKFILVSFPHVEGETTPERPARGTREGSPRSAHARTRLAAEQYLLKACEGTVMTPVILRPGMIYSRGILMIDAAKWLSRHRLLAVWRRPTWIHLLSLPDFLAAAEAAVEKPQAQGIYNLGDDAPLTLQEFLDRATEHWGNRAPWRAPERAFWLAGALTEIFATVFRTQAPLTRDFIRIGMASYAMDTSRMKDELLPQLEYPTLEEGMALL